MENSNNSYYARAKLMLETIPFCTEEECFALKGGTAINFFLRDMPRLSIDIDLTYLPIESREESLNNISSALNRITKNIEKQMAGVKVQQGITNNPKVINKLFVNNGDVQIKVEPNFTIRGSVFPIEEHVLSSKAQELFNIYIETRIVSVPDVFGGKICAALDRQHPRDLFDIKYLFDNEGITESIRKGFLIYLISHDRPIHELINPKMNDFKSVYESEFLGMSNQEITYNELLDVRINLVNHIQQSITHEEKRFLISFKNAQPEWNLLGIEGVQHLPAVQWKLLNIQKMNDLKREEYLEKLERSLSKNIKRKL